MITHHQLRAFLAVVRAGSITKAARELHAKQPSVSLQLNALRKFLGPPLFERPNGRFQLTPAGEKLRRYAEDVLGGLRTLQQDMAAIQGGVAGPLTVGLTYLLNRYVMPCPISRFIERFPGVGVDIHVEFPEPMLDGLLRNSLDVMFYIKGPIMPGVSIESLCDEPFETFVSPGHTLARRRRVEPEELARYPFVAPASPSLRALIESKLRAIGIVPRVGAEARHADAIKKLVGNGHAWSVVIRSAIADELKAGRLVALRLAGPPLVAELAAAYRSHPAPSMLVSEFVAFIRADLLAHSPVFPDSGRQRRRTKARSLTGAGSRS
jgi:DNA-binding transcriptional LysR family regulator